MSIFIDKKYPANKSYQTTLFMPLGSSLGDNIVFDAIKQKYELDNPDERIVYLDYSFDIDKYKKRNVGKVFINTDGMLIPIPKWKNVVLYDLFDEVTELAKEGIYPKYEFSTSEKIIYSRFNNFIALHSRNIKKAKGKNISNDLFSDLIELLSCTNYEQILIVGNDNSYENDDFNSGFIIDFRDKLSLDTIAHICNISSIFIGSDSGICHLAAASGAKKMMCFNYTDKKYFVKTSNENICLMRDESNIENIKNSIEYY